MIRAAGRVSVPLSAVAIVGRNQRLQHRIARQARTLNYPLHAVGFVDNVYDYMDSGRRALTKPGGLSSSEALVAQLPMVLVWPLPGQEERNTRYLVDRRAAVRVGTERSLVQALESLLTDRPRAEALREAREPSAGPRPRRRSPR